MIERRIATYHGESGTVYYIVQHSTLEEENWSIITSYARRELAERHVREWTMTGEEKAKEKGLESYDFALPHDWAVAAESKSGINPSGHVVWSYETPGLFGAPVGIDLEGEQIVSLMAAAGR